MPAAVALVSTPDAPPDEGPRAGQPYMTPVPDCEPPFDDELVAVSRIRAAPDPVPAPIRSARGQDRFRPTVDRQQPDPRPAGGHQQPPGWSPAAAITANAVIGGTRFRAPRPWFRPPTCRRGRRRRTSAYDGPPPPTCRRLGAVHRCWPERSSRYWPGADRSASCGCTAHPRYLPDSPSGRPPGRPRYRT